MTLLVPGRESAARAYPNTWRLLHSLPVWSADTPTASIPFKYKILRTISEKWNQKFIKVIEYFDLRFIIIQLQTENCFWKASA